MQATTTTKLENVLKECWNREIFDAYLDMKRDVERQLMYGNPRYGGYTAVGSGSNVIHVPVMWSTNPTEHARRVEEMSQRYAQLKRRNKPSYRQRQKNGRAARRG